MLTRKKWHVDLTVVRARKNDERLLDGKFYKMKMILDAGSNL